MLKPVYFAFVKTMLEFFLQTTHFVKSRAHSPRPKSKIISIIALRRAIFMKADPVVSLHANRLFSGRACSCKSRPPVNVCMRSSSICVFEDRGKPEYPKKKKETSRSKGENQQHTTHIWHPRRDMNPEYTLAPPLLLRVSFGTYRCFMRAPQK